MMHLTLLAALALSAPSTRAALPEDSVYLLDRALSDQDGHTVRLSDFRGHPVFITMFYGSCTTVCPLLVSKLKQLEATLPEAARLDARFVLVSFDPEHDTAAALKALAQNHRVDQSRWRFLRADDEGVRLLAAVLGIKYHRLNSGGFWHASVVAVLDREGRIAARVEGLDANMVPLQQAAVAAPR